MEQRILEIIQLKQTHQNHSTPPPPTSTSPQTSLLYQKDLEYSNYRSVIIKSQCFHSSSRHVQIRLKEWIIKLDKIKYNKKWVFNRNNYIKLLYLMCECHVLIEPFNALPPSKDIPNLVNHQINNIMNIISNTIKHSPSKAYKNDMAINSYDFCDLQFSEIQLKEGKIVQNEGQKHQIQQIMRQSLKNRSRYNTKHSEEQQLVKRQDDYDRKYLKQPIFSRYHERYDTIQKDNEDDDGDNEPTEDYIQELSQEISLIQINSNITPLKSFLPPTINHQPRALNQPTNTPKTTNQQDKQNINTKISKLSLSKLSKPPIHPSSSQKISAQKQPTTTKAQLNTKITKSKSKINLAFNSTKTSHHPTSNYSSVKTVDSRWWQQQKDMSGCSMQGYQMQNCQRSGSMSGCSRSGEMQGCSQLVDGSYTDGEGSLFKNILMKGRAINTANVSQISFRHKSRDT